jgi:hypothetical protein
VSKMVLGRWADGVDVKLDLARLLLTRMLIQANSGNGKSWALRRLFERAAGLVQQIIVDPEGEFASLREKHDFLIVAANGGDAVAHPRTAALLAIRLLETEASAVLDISELKAADRHAFVRLLFESLIDAPKNLRHPVLVELDEAQIFAPEKGQGESEATDSVIDMATRGRKRGLCLIAATQRISMFHKGVAAELKNRMIGGTSLDVDVKRAAFDLGMSPKDALIVLRAFEPGHFFAYGPAFGQLEPREFVTGDVETSHPKVGHRQAAPPKPTAAIIALLPKLADLAEEAEERARSMDDLKRELSQVRRELTVAKKQQPPPAPAPVIKGDPAAERRAAAQIGKLTALIEELMKFIVTVTAKDFDGAGGVDVEAMRKAIEAAVEQSRKLVERSMDVRNAELKALQSQASKIVTRVRKLLDTQEVHVDVEVRKNAPFTVTPAPAPMRPAAAAPVRVQHNGDARLSRPQQVILDQLAVLKDRDIYPASRATLAAFCKVSPSSSGYEKNLSTLKTLGMIEYPRQGEVAFTPEGQAEAAAPFDDGTPPAEFWLAIVNEPKAKILRALIDEHPTAMARVAIAQKADVSENSSGFEKNLSQLKTLGAIEYPMSGVVALTRFVMPE